MDKHRKVWLLFLTAGLLAACTLLNLRPAPVPTRPPVTPGDVPGAIQRLTVLYTNDEHGWMEGEKTGQGAANLNGLWRQADGFPNQGDFLILSGGDNSTGPAISSWFQGESMVDVMNAMGYAASAVGNHEFDFGLEALKQRAAQAKFAYLSANLRYKDSGKPPTDLGIQPYAIFTRGGLKVAVIGLTTVSAAYTANPTYTGKFDFLDYAEALRQAVPQARQAGAQVVLVAAHICQSEVEKLAAQVQDLHLNLIGGGHCNELFAEPRDGTLLLEGGAHLASYAYAVFTYEPVSGQTKLIDYGTRRNQGGPADPKVAQVVATWHDKVSTQANVKIGYLQHTLAQDSPDLQALIVNSWLWSYPKGDIALTNLGGIRDRLPAGEITLGGITSVMPFTNVIVDVKLTGAQVRQVLLAHTVSPPAIGGLHRQDGTWILDKTGRPLENDAAYSVLVNDFMYAGGDRYDLLARFDPEAYNTAIDWRQPVIDWIKAQNSSPEHPLDPILAKLVR